MTLSAEEKRDILVRAKARKFAEHVRNNPGLAFLIPEDIVDWLKDEEIQLFFSYCRQFRIVQREDNKWESRTL